MCDEWKVWKELFDGGDFHGLRSRPDDPAVKPDWWNARWIPLTYNGCGDHHCLDLDPGECGRVGQIIVMWHDAAERPIDSRDFASWLEDFADELEADRYVTSEDYYGLCRIENV